MLNEIMEDDELLKICQRLENKVKKYFEITLQRELKKITHKKITEQQYFRLICYALSMLNADQINFFCFSIKRADLSMKMMDSISHITQQVVYDFYEANKEQFQSRNDH